MAPETNSEGRAINEGGRYEQKMTADDVYEFFDEVRGPVLVAGDVAEAFDCTPETARRRLRDLYYDDRIDKREARRRILWWRKDEATGNAEDDPDTVLKRLSNELGEPITVGETVYEAGDKHPVGETDGPAAE